MAFLENFNAAGVIFSYRYKELKLRQLSCEKTFKQNFLKIARNLTDLVVHSFHC